MLAFVLLYVAFDRLAAALGSTRGEAGLVVYAVVLALVVTARAHVPDAQPGHDGRAENL